MGLPPIQPGGIPVSRSAADVFRGRAAPLPAETVRAHAGGGGSGNRGSAVDSERAGSASRIPIQWTMIKQVTVSHTEQTVGSAGSESAPVSDGGRVPNAPLSAVESSLDRQLR